VDYYLNWTAWCRTACQVVWEGEEISPYSIISFSDRDLMCQRTPLDFYIHFSAVSLVLLKQKTS
jgi:hypothetical protein